MRPKKLNHNEHEDRMQTSFFSNRLSTALCLFLFIQGCSFFGGDEEEAFDVPAELVDFYSYAGCKSCMENLDWKGA